MKNKGGEVYGSIYERRRKDRNTIAYTAEIQFQGQKIRRSGKDKDKLNEWMKGVCLILNEILNEYRATESIRVKLLKDQLYSDMTERANAIMVNAKVHDFRSKICAQANGISPKDHFQTYLIRDEETDLIKIGKSHDIHKRMAVMGKWVTLIGYCDDDIEVKLHKQFAKQRIKGEWFNLSTEDIDGIISANGFTDTRGYFLERGAAFM